MYYDEQYTDRGYSKDYIFDIFEEACDNCVDNRIAWELVQRHLQFANCPVPSALMEFIDCVLDN